MASSTSHNPCKPRDSIGSLCQLLNLTGASIDINAEIFRQAKFNKPQAVTKLLCLLGKVTYYVTHGSLPSKMPSPDLLAIQKTVLVLGYRSPEFYQASPGSRELLLVLAFLLGKTDILPSLMLQRSAPVFVSELHLEDVRSRLTERRSQANEGGVSDALHATKHLTWLVGHCRMGMRLLYQQQQELCKLTHQIHVATQGVSVSAAYSHLTPLETFLIRHTHKLKQHLEDMASEHSRLQVCLRWQQQEGTFWQWMESVLDARRQDATPCSENDLAVPSPNGQGLSGILTELEANSQKLSRLVQDHGLDADSMVNRDTMYTSDPRRVTLPIKDQPMPSVAPHHMTRLSFDTRMHLASQTTKRSKPIDSVPTNRKMPHVEREIERLSGLVDGLKDTLVKLRREHRVRIDRLTLLLPDVVCIPPMGVDS